MTLDERDVVTRSELRRDALEKNIAALQNDVKDLKSKLCEGEDCLLKTVSNINKNIKKFQCDSCGGGISLGDKFCNSCSRPIKWVEKK